MAILLNLVKKKKRKLVSGDRGCETKNNIVENEPLLESFAGRNIKDLTIQ